MKSFEKSLAAAIVGSRGAGEPRKDLRLSAWQGKDSIRALRRTVLFDPRMPESLDR